MIYRRYSITWRGRHMHTSLHWENFHSEYGATLQLKKNIQNKNVYIFRRRTVIEDHPLEFGFFGTVIFLQTVPLHTRYVYKMHFYILYFHVYAHIKLKC